MLSKKAQKQDEEARKLSAFCRYIRKNPDLFIQHNLHDLMLKDQDAKGGIKNAEEIKPEIKEPEKIDDAPIEIEIKKEKKAKKPRKEKKKKEIIPEISAAPVEEIKKEPACPKMEVQEEKESELKEAPPAHELNL